MANVQQELIGLLQSAGQGNHAALQRIQQLSEQNFGQFAFILSEIFGKSDVDQFVRQQAGLQLKNNLISKHAREQALLSKRWSGLPADLRARIKTVVFNVLHAPLKAMTDIAALVIAKIASIDIPERQWDQLVPELVQNIGNPGSTNRLKESSLTTLGYVCEEVGEPLQGFSNKILTAISLGMKPEEQDQALRLAATMALKNSLGFVRKNFEDKGERTLIMRMVFASIVSPDKRVREAGFMCLVQIAASYYPHIGPFMDYITKLTLDILQKDDEIVCFQAIEFWNTIAEIESDLREEEELYTGEDEPSQQHEPEIKSLKITNHFAKDLIPVLLPCLTKQSDEVGDDTWNVASAAGSCLIVLSQAVGDGIVPLVLPFVKENFNNKHSWRMRDAAIVTFGTILDGPDPTKLTPMVQGAFLNLLNHLKDEHTVVQDSAAWTISRICNLLPTVLTPEPLSKLVDAMCFGLRCAPPVAHKICVAIFNLADAQVLPDHAETSALSPHFPRLLKALLSSTNRNDVAEGGLLTAIYESVSMLIGNAAPDCFDFIASLIPDFLKLLNNTLNNPGLTPQEIHHIASVQALICGSLQTITVSLRPHQLQPHLLNMAKLFTQCLRSKHAVVVEEALRATASVATLIGKDFLNFMPNVQAVLLQALNSPHEFICTVAVGALGDFSRALEKEIRPILQPAVQALLRNLQDEEVLRTLKPEIMSCLGDLAMNSDPADFGGYVPYIVMYLEQAGNTEIDVDDDESYEFQQRLWSSILDAYIGLLHGFKQDNVDQNRGGGGGGGGGGSEAVQKGISAIQTSVDKMFNFLAMISKTESKDTQVLKEATSLLGDLISNFGQKLSGYVRNADIIGLVEAAMRSEDEEARDVGMWVKNLITNISDL